MLDVAIGYCNFYRVFHLQKKNINAVICVLAQRDENGYVLTGNNAWLCWELDG